MIQNGYWDLIEQYINQLNTYAVYTNYKKMIKEKTASKPVD